MEWPRSCLASRMMARFLLILGGLFVVALVGAFMFYVSVLSIVTAIAVLIGLIATLVLGYWAGSISPDQPPRSAKGLRAVQVTNAPGEVTFLPEIPITITKLHTRMGLILRKGQTQGAQAASDR